MTRTLLFLMATLGVIAGCGAFTLSPQQRIAITAGRIGCPADKTTVENLERQGGGMSTWIAKCEGRTYSCSRAENQTSCTGIPK